METYVKIGGQEYTAKVRLRRADPDHGCRRTATVRMVGTVEQVKALFADGKPWQTVERDEAGEEWKSVDQSEYEKLLVVKDHLDGTVSAVLCAVTAEEILDVLLGGL